MLQHALLYFIPSRQEFLKIQPGTGDNLSPEDISAGFTDYILWNRFITGPLDIDGELEMECVDSGMLLLDPLRQAQGRLSTTALQASAQDDTGGQAEDDTGGKTGDLLKDVLEMAYGDKEIVAILLLHGDGAAPTNIFSTTAR